MKREPNADATLSMVTCDLSKELEENKRERRGEEVEGRGERERREWRGEGERGERGVWFVMRGRLVDEYGYE